MPHRVESGQCKHFAICHRPATWAEGGEVFCVLHLPVGQSVQALSDALNEYRQGGGCDFSYMVFPPNFGPLVLDNHDFEDVAIFRDVKCVSLVLTGSRFKRDVIIQAGGLNAMSLERATIAGALALKAETVRDGIMMTRATIGGPTDISVASSTLEFRLLEARFGGPLHVKAYAVRGQWDNALFEDGLQLRARVESVSVAGSEFKGILDLQDCQFVAGFNLAGAVFREGVVLDLSRARVRGDFVLTGHATLPKEVRLEGIVVDGNVRVETELRAAAPRLIARDERPRFASAEFTNVDLSECLLVGNAFQRMSFSRVLWPIRAGRYLLFDEIVERQQDLPLDSLKEAYQILKQKSQEAGNHAHAGDFHYGELEMRRHAWGPLGSLFCLEFLYWLLSGYGTRPRRAFVAFGVLTVVAACLYWYLGEGGASTLADALRFSLAVSTLQRRETGAVGSWIQVIQTILAAIILALLVLAVRLRVKR